MSQFDRLHDELSLYDISHASPFGSDSDQYAFNVISQSNYEAWCRKNMPPPSCNYCEHHWINRCMLDFQKRYFGKCEKYSWNGEPEDEEERYYRLHPNESWYGDEEI